MQQPQDKNGEKRFWAFISYSHADSKETAWLHKALETFKVPSPLVGTESRAGVVPKRIFPIFRDRDELPTSSDLGDNLQSALRNSKYLVVVCSPRSANSIWVNTEVAFFKRTHGNANVLCLIVGGTPGGDGDGEAGECFCPALRHHVNTDGSLGGTAEPIAADLRDNKDGRQRALLKIVAGILGVNFDVLYQRERRRQRNRVLVAGVGLLAFALVGGHFLLKLRSVAQSQIEIASAVKEMRQLNFRKFGDLPEARRREFERIMDESGVLNARKQRDAALAVEAARFARYRERLSEFSRQRASLIGSLETLIDAARPAVGWSRTAAVLASLPDLPAPNVAAALAMKSSNFRTGAIAGHLSSIERVRAEATAWNEAVKVSAAFSGLLDKARDLERRMNAIGFLVPSDFEVGSAEPKPGWNPALDLSKALNLAAWHLATHPDLRKKDSGKALEFATKATALTEGKFAPFLDTLAASHAAAGDFDSALRFQRLAIERGASESPEEQQGFLTRYRLYEGGKVYSDPTPHPVEFRDVMLGIANPDGLDAWTTRSRECLQRLESLLDKFPVSVEEKVVVAAQIEKLKEVQAELEGEGYLRLNQLRRAYTDDRALAMGALSGTGYKPLPELDGYFVLSEKLWHKPPGAPQRGGDRMTVSTITTAAGTQKVTKTNREGSVELYCIRNFVIPARDGMSLDIEKMMAAISFADSAARFLSTEVP
jgi:hypothetical protein